MSETRHFLRFAGRRFENGQFEPELGWETEMVSARPAPAVGYARRAEWFAARVAELSREYEVALRDAEGHVLVTVPPGVERDRCREARGRDALDAADRVRAASP